MDGATFQAVTGFVDHSERGRNQCFNGFTHVLTYAQVLTNTILEQIFEIEYLVQHGQCSDCAKLAAKNTWKALVQVRQKVPHKRTFLFLEQLILKHGAQKDTISVKEVKDGLDFFYSQRNHAIKMTEFLAGVVPVRFVSDFIQSSLLIIIHIQVERIRTAPLNRYTHRYLQLQIHLLRRDHPHLQGRFSLYPIETGPSVREHKPFSRMHPCRQFDTAP